MARLGIHHVRYLLVFYISKPDTYKTNLKYMFDLRPYELYSELSEMTPFRLTVSGEIQGL